MPPLDMASLEGRNCSASAFDLPWDSFDDPLPVLYQSGYLTIKNYDREFGDYTLGFPNQEVDVEEVKAYMKTVATVYGREIAIEIAMQLLGCSREEAEKMLDE